MEKQCAVCKKEMSSGEHINTPIGDVCCSICRDYVNEQLASPRLNEADSQLNEVRLIL